MIESTCSSVDSESTGRLLNQISSTIITNELFTLQQTGKNTLRGTNRNRMMNGLIPVNSRLYSNGSNTNEQPDIEIIKDLLEVKLKIDEIEDIEDDYDDRFTNQPIRNDGSAEKLLTGHFRFHLPPMISPQLIILVKSPNQSDQISNQLLLFFHGNLKFLPVFTKHLQNQFNCAISDLNIDNDSLKSCLNWSVLNDKLNTIGGIQLWFGKLQTKGKLGTIVINIDEKDIFKFRDICDQYYKENEGNDDTETLSVLLFEYLSSQTQISFDKLTLVKLKCQLFTISVDGKVRFNSLMSHLGKKAKEAKGDERLSIWWIIRLLCFVK